MTRLFLSVVMLFVAVSSFDIAQAEEAEEKVFIEEIGGEVTKSTADVIHMLQARKRDRALSEYQQKKNNVGVAAQTSPDVEAIQQKLIANMASKQETPVETATIKNFKIASSVNQETPGDASRISADQKIWGSFPEASAWAGAWINPKFDTQGAWTDLKYLQWFTKFEQPENFALGARLRGDYGWRSGTPAEWGHVAPGVAAGYYRGLGLRSSFETDAALLWRFDMNRKDGLMPVAHAEFNRILGYKDRLMFQADGSYFPGDSFLGPGIYWEHKLNKDWKSIVGAGANLSWLDGDFLTGFAPSVKVKYKNKFTLGVSANLFTGLGAFYGIIAAYESTPDISTWYAEFNQRSIKLKQEMKKDQGADNSSMGIQFKTYNQMEEKEAGK